MLFCHVAEDEYDDDDEDEANDDEDDDEKKMCQGELLVSWVSGLDRAEERPCMEKVLSLTMTMMIMSIIMMMISRIMMMMRAYQHFPTSHIPTRKYVIMMKGGNTT